VGEALKEQHRVVPYLEVDRIPAQDLDGSSARRVPCHIATELSHVVTDELPVRKQD